METFYRVANNQTKQGLWYDQSGEFTGLIHNDFSFCMNNSLKMPFDESLVGWLSATPSLEDLFKWFSKDDIEKLEKHGYFITEYKTENVRFYNPFQHHIICQENSKLIRQISIKELTSNIVKI